MPAIGTVMAPRMNRRISLPDPRLIYIAQTESVETGRMDRRQEFLRRTSAELEQRRQEHRVRKWAEFVGCAERLRAAGLDRRETCLGRFLETREDPFRKDAR